MLLLSEVCVCDCGYQELGTGSYSVCRHCVHRTTGREYAVKVGLASVQLCTAPYISDIWYSCTYRSWCRACCSDKAWAAGQTISWRYITQSGYSVMSIYTTAGPHASVRSCSAFGNSANAGHCQSAHVFVFDQLYCWTTSSWTWSRFHVVLKPLNSDVFQSALGHNVVEVWRLMSRPRRFTAVIRHWS